MADKIRLSIVSQEGTVFEQQVSYVNIPTGFGSIGILSGHAPLLCAVEPGILRCRFGQEETARVRVGSGIANVSQNEVTLLISEAELVD